MINILGSIPHSFYIAVSGGIDSMAVLSFFQQGKKDIHVLYFNHDTNHGKEAEKFVKDYCSKHNIPVTTGILTGNKPSHCSQEEYWRDARYSFFSKFNDKPIITCHHLNDVIETWLFTSIHGNPKLIPYRRDNFIRPFLTTPKVEFINWIKRKGIPYIQDESNFNTKYMRNYIRHELVDRIKVINPGIEKTIKKKVLEEYKNVLTPIES